MSKLSKNIFCDMIDKLKEASDLRNKVDTLFRESRENIDCDFANSASLQVAHESSVIQLLQILMDDTEDDNRYSDISYFIYELDYGRKYKPGMITDQDGNDIDFSTAEKLYDYLVEKNKL